MDLPFSGASFLVVGPVCVDLTPAGPQAGGCATYASLAARNLGAETRVVTACGPEIDPNILLPGIDVYRHLTPNCTAFRNTYLNDERQQTLVAWAGVVPETPYVWRGSSVVLMGPLAQDVPVQWIDQFPGSIVGLAPQGWLREWDEYGRVRPALWQEAEWALGKATVTILSMADLGNDRSVLANFVNWSRLLVATEGALGATVYYEGKAYRRPAFPAREVDPTGAGDVFAAAFLLHLAQENDPLAACDFANCVASFTVQATGIAGIPTWKDVSAKLTAVSRKASTNAILEK